MSTEWTLELTVNDELLDRQHVALFRLLAGAADAVGVGPDGLELAVAAFADELLDHVATEEALMEEAAYPDRARHKTAHEMFVADLVQARGELAALGATPAVIEWVRVRAPEWLRFHIRTNDAPLGTFLARRRAQLASGRGWRAEPKRFS
jgi:hemerythrin